MVDLGSITAAARSLGETKGTVSRRLTRLEAALGVTLLRRSPRLVQATEDGAAYRTRIGRALELIDDANTELRHDVKTPAGHIRVTAPTDIGHTLLAPRMAAFHARFPEVSVELLLTDALLDFDAHQIDLGLRAGGPLRDSSMVAVKLLDLDGRLYASPEYLKLAGRPRSVAELGAHRMLLQRATRGAATLQLARGAEKPESLRVKGAICASDFAFLKAAAVAHAGVALLPSLVAQRDVTDGRLVPVLREYTAFSGVLSLLHPGGRILPLKVRAFRDFLVASCAARRRPPRPPSEVAESET